MEKKHGFFKRIAIFYGEVKAEMKKVTWPTRNELYGATVVVIIVTLAITAVLGGFDWILGQILNIVMGL
ncbi:MAG: preprotein translocase subunit SecE [Candidatus Sumerlaeaceae bacterium]|nr:preprotein translocase subunit SecE [Candidatus Sumerlaeaceae bacterium]